MTSPSLTSPHTEGSRPFFSIVMPTRERGHLLRHALKSALSQTFEDYEIVVSDNYSTDGTEEVVRELADERVRYVRTEKRLSMPDNWEFAFEHARGEYVTYLCDDDAISPRLLEKLYEVLADRSEVSVGWKRTTYYCHPDWPEKEARGSLFFLSSGTGEVQELSSSTLLEKLFAFELIDYYPTIHLSCCSREFLEQRKARMGGRLFLPIGPDISSGVATLTGADRVLFIDEDLVVVGEDAASNGASYLGTNALQTFMSEFPDLEKIWRIPLTSMSLYNYVAVTLIALKDVLAEELAPYSLSTTNLFIREHQEMEVMKSYGVDVSQAREDWNRALAAQSAEVRRAVRRATSLASPGALTGRFKTATRKRFPAMVYGMYSARAWMKERGVPLKGTRRYRFDDIFEV